MFLWQVRILTPERQHVDRILNFDVQIGLASRRGMVQKTVLQV